MPSVVEEVPERLQPAADAALTRINAQQDAQFRITGLVDPEEALAKCAGEPLDLGLVLCDGNRCVREQLRVSGPAHQGRAGTVPLRR